MIKAFAVVSSLAVISSLSCENRNRFDGDWASTGPPPSLGPPSPSRRFKHLNFFTHFFRHFEVSGFWDFYLAFNDLVVTI